MDYFFPDFDSTTPLVMIDELDKDIESGLFYAPASITSLGVHVYKGLLKKTFSDKNLEFLQPLQTQTKRTRNTVVIRVLFV